MYTTTHDDNTMHIYYTTVDHHQALHTRVCILLRHHPRTYTPIRTGIYSASCVLSSSSILGSTSTCGDVNRSERNYECTCEMAYVDHVDDARMSCPAQRGDIATVNGRVAYLPASGNMNSS
jgi:hypothetical protein